VTDASGPADDYFPAYGDRAYSVEHYDLGLDYSLESNRLAARAVIDAKMWLRL
jgi:aminopeptidase